MESAPGLPFQNFRLCREFSSGTDQKNVYHLHPNRNFREFVVNGKPPVCWSPEQVSTHKEIFKGCVPFGESKNGFLILDLPDFSVERNVKSEIGFVSLVTFRQRVQYARQPLKK